MKQRFYLFKRGRVYYVQDAQTGKQFSLKTSNHDEAEQLFQAKVQSVRQPFLNVAMAKALLAAADPMLPKRTWQLVMDDFISRSGKESTRTRRERALRSNVFDSIRNRPLIETSADHFRAILKSGGAFAHNCLRCLHNLALGLGWLPWPVIPSKLWPTLRGKAKRAWEEHQSILIREKNEERRLYYDILWELGASQTDAALLAAENVDWECRVLTYDRHKTGETASVVIGKRLEKFSTNFHQSVRFFHTAVRPPPTTEQRNSEGVASYWN